jgi:UDP-N-acetylglucosamine 2-epimerase (non-hydrolysing)
MTKRVLSVVGTRPEAIKMAPVVRALTSVEGFESRVCVTAQHRQMLDQVLNLFSIKPDYDLDLMRENQSLADLGAAIFSGLQPVLTDFSPHWVLVQGDTATVAITALLAYYMRIRVGHVEAGLRTHNKWQPFPEEINRRVAGAVADLHFAPTAGARDNLLAEGVTPEHLVVTGNPVIDALQLVADRPTPPEIQSLLQRLGVEPSKPSKASQSDRRLVLVTAHRRESFGRPLEQIMEAVRILGQRGDLEIVYPVHLNPNVQEPATRILGNAAHVTLLPPQDYLPLVHLMKQCTLILTDSGGIQEEAPAFGIPVLVLRDVTERPEGVQAGSLVVVGTDRDRIVDEANRLLDDPEAYSRMARAVNPYGDGHAAEKIVDALLAFEDQ